MFKTSLITVFAAAALAMAGEAQAAYTTFSGIDTNGNAGVQVAPTNANAARNAFFSGLQGVGTQDFEAFSVGSNAASVSPMSFGVAGTATFTGNGSVRSNNAGQSNGAGRYSVPGGTRFWETNAGSGNFELLFSSSIAAFGFYGIDMGDFAGTLQLQFYNAANALVRSQNITTAAQNVADGSVLYFGLIATTPAEEFQRIAFTSTGGSGDVFAFDSFSIGTREQVTTVPEPSTALLLGGALLGLGAVRRRRAQK